MTAWTNAISTAVSDTTYDRRTVLRTALAGLVAGPALASAARPGRAAGETVYDPVEFAGLFARQFKGYEHLGASWYYDPDAAADENLLPSPQRPRGWIGVLRSTMVEPADDDSLGQNFSAVVRVRGHWYETAGDAQEGFDREVESIEALGYMTDETGEAKIGAEGRIYTASFPAQSGSDVFINRFQSPFRRDIGVITLVWDTYSVGSSPIDLGLAIETAQTVERNFRASETERTLTVYTPLIGNPGEINLDIGRAKKTFIPVFDQDRDARNQRREFAAAQALWQTRTTYQTPIGDNPVQIATTSWQFPDPETAATFFPELDELVGESDRASGIDRVEIDVSLEAETGVVDAVTANNFVVKVGDQAFAGVECRRLLGSDIDVLTIVDGTPLPNETTAEEVVESHGLEPGLGLNVLLWAFARWGGGQLDWVESADDSGSPVADESTQPLPVGTRLDLPEG
jgi:hypothetical protein